MWKKKIVDRNSGMIFQGQFLYNIKITMESEKKLYFGQTWSFDMLNFGIFATIFSLSDSKKTL